MTTTTDNKDLSAIDDNALDMVRTVADATSFFANLGVDVYDNEADGIRSLDVLDDKDRLLKTPFLMLRWRFNEGDMGEFVSIEAMLGDSTVVVINDGSTGIREQSAIVVTFL